jgi:hypothetical protein
VSGPHSAPTVAKRKIEKMRRENGKRIKVPLKIDL